MSGGYAINSDAERNRKEWLAMELDRLAEHANRIGLWRNGEPFGNALKETAAYLKPKREEGTAISLLKKAVEYLEENHQNELQSAHQGDVETNGPAPEACDYCNLIDEARQFLKAQGRNGDDEPKPPAAAPAKILTTWTALGEGRYRLEANGHGFADVEFCSTGTVTKTRW